MYTHTIFPLKGYANLIKTLRNCKKTEEYFFRYQ